ncbi:hypothetical protein NIES2100_64900 [Calothrix sp. NIES-2100]|nr:hypothetical protein NIES2100_64900 [Calothrix sp. NIES-2100]
MKMVIGHLSIVPCFTQDRKSGIGHGAWGMGHGEEMEVEERWGRKLPHLSVRAASPLGRSSDACGKPLRVYGGSLARDFSPCAPSLPLHPQRYGVSCRFPMKQDDSNESIYNLNATQFSIGLDKNQ